jgi:geranylgeranyl diphosphate synthase, type II
MDPGSAYLSECRQLVLSEIVRMVPQKTRFESVLYELMLDYPMRDAKALRPSLCIAVCRSLGGSLEGVLQSAAVLELYHNAFLIHDDVEDASAQRRGVATLHDTYGIPIAVNVGDAMLALALDPLFDNMRLLGLGKALRILKAVGEMAKHTAEGQALELSWIRTATWQLDDADYLRMVHRKTTWYSFLTPVTIGAMVAGASSSQMRGLRLFATALGAAFQIQDDVLNLAARPEDYGKDLLGDLWEGKRTLVLLHALRMATPLERARAHVILRLPRAIASNDVGLDELVLELQRRGELSAGGARELQARLSAKAEAHPVKTDADIAWLMNLIERYGSLNYARLVAQRHASRARRSLEAVTGLTRRSTHYVFLESLLDFVVSRDH